MRRFFLAVIVLGLPLASVSIRAAQDGAAAPAAAPAVPAPTGNPENGKAVYAFGNTSCTNCHGANGEGAFGPALAGRNIGYARALNYIRKPTGKMPGYVPSELTDQEIADMVSYWNTLPKAEKPLPWRTPMPENPTPTQRIAINLGCGQCHGDTLDTPRHGMAEVTADFEWFKKMVYDHVNAQREQWSLLDPKLPRVTPGPAGPPGRNRIRMGVYTTRQVPEATLKQIWDWAAVELGQLPVLNGRLTAGATDASGASYTLVVTNASVKGRGLGTEGVSVSLLLPEGVTVVSQSGATFEGVKRDEEAKSNAAVWRIAAMPAADQQTLTFKLSAAPPTLKGIIRWDKPAVKADGEVNFQLAGAGRGRG